MGSGLLCCKTTAKKTTSFGLSELYCITVQSVHLLMDGRLELVSVRVQTMATSPAELHCSSIEAMPKTGVICTQEVKLF